MAHESRIGTEFRDSLLYRFRLYKTLGDRTLEQLEDKDLSWRSGETMNSAQVIIRHLHGNMRSVWSDFLRTDHEKPDRDRDGEFVDDENLNVESAQHLWEVGWKCLFDSYSALSSDDLLKSVRLRGSDFTVVEALLKQYGHVAYHVGQLVLIGKARRGKSWKPLTIPVGKSRDWEFIKLTSPEYERLRARDKRNPQAKAGGEKD